MLYDTIYFRLKEATSDELDEICKALQIEPATDNIKKISKEYRSAAGHSLFAFRDFYDLPYKQILIDVVDKLNPWCWTDYALSDNTTEEQIENKIEKLIFEKVKKEWNKLSPLEKKNKEKKLKEELKKAGYSQTTVCSVISVLASGNVALATAAPLTLSIFYSGFFASLSASIFGASSSLLLLSGTGVGALVAIPLLAVTLGGPAYRKTIPATIQMIRIRRRLEGEAEL